MAGILEKRQAIHSRLATEQERNAELQSHVDSLQPLANVGLVSSMIAHEINNILTPLGSYAELSLQHPDDPNLTEKALKKTLANTKRASQILDSMLKLASNKPQPKEICNVNALLDEVFQCIARDLGKDGISVERDIPEELAVSVQPNLFQQVLMNLILNARQAMLPAGGRLRILAAIKTDCVEISVFDTGEGIAASDLGHVFEPFFTKRGSEKSDKKGSGLGLAFCKKIVEAHGGTISVDSERHVGTTFKITLPNA
ncbi:Sporulation kinase D [Anaerohalosphaera lusitana]|uniref:histidine kinase n=1 Tax=Anaerohalosphaera lusitana TaxID=1936003 RepID=A0A1U9NMT7_9BACT|nr:HAMP domain-containing sensor histidine kinase [Anaerohalosphaera lusitana]AQT69145.1 Sporulation kinase D [Anaerohalosphaera lusitana]